MKLAVTIFILHRPEAVQPDCWLYMLCQESLRLTVWLFESYMVKRQLVTFCIGLKRDRNDCPDQRAHPVLRSKIPLIAGKVKTVILNENKFTE